MLFRSVAFLWGMTAVAAVDPIQVTLDWPHANSDNNSMATTSLSHYGKPPEGCGDDELVLQIQGVPGVICAPSCSFTKPCPSDLPDGVSGMYEYEQENRSMFRRRFSVCSFALFSCRVLFLHCRILDLLMLFFLSIFFGQHLRNVP